jgi:hypothetical protein
MRKVDTSVHRTADSAYSRKLRGSEDIEKDRTLLPDEDGRVLLGGPLFVGVYRLCLDSASRGGVLHSKLVSSTTESVSPIVGFVDSQCRSPTRNLDAWSGCGESAIEAIS